MGKFNVGIWEVRLTPVHVVCFIPANIYKAGILISICLFLHSFSQLGSNSEEEDRGVIFWPLKLVTNQVFNHVGEPSP